MSKKQEHNRHSLQDQWERAVERAAEGQRADGGLDCDALQDAAGLHVQAGVQAGRAWTHTCNSCATTCACGD